MEDFFDDESLEDEPLEDEPPDDELPVEELPEDGVLDESFVAFDDDALSAFDAESEELSLLEDESEPDEVSDFRPLEPPPWSFL